MTGLNSLGIVKVIVFLFALSGMSVNAEEKNTLVVASLLQPGVENNPDKIMARAARIIQQMSIPGLIDVEIKEYKSITEVIDAFASGDVDWATSSLFPALIYAEYADADIFEQRLKLGIPKFYSVFFVRKDSSVNALADIEKKILSFGNAFSSGAYFAPYYELNEQHYNMINYGAKLDDEIVGSKRRIYYKFAYNEDEIVRNVLTGKSDAGVMSKEDYDQLPDEKREGLKIIHQTAAFVKNVEVLRGDLELEIKRKLQQVIVEDNLQEERPMLVADNDKTTRFYKFVGEGRDGFVYLRSLVEHRTVPVLIEKKEKKKKKNYFY